MRAISHELGRDVSTMGRELDHNSDESRRYGPFAARWLAAARLAGPRQR